MYFLSFPTEIIFNILVFCSFKSLIVLSLTSKTLYNISREGILYLIEGYKTLLLTEDLDLLFYESIKCNISIYSFLKNRGLPYAGISIDRYTIFKYFLDLDTVYFKQIRMYILFISTYYPFAIQHNKHLFINILKLEDLLYEKSKKEKYIIYNSNKYLKRMFFLFESTLQLIKGSTTIYANITFTTPQHKMILERIKFVFNLTVRLRNSAYPKPYILNKQIKNLMKNV